MSGASEALPMPWEETEERQRRRAVAAYKNAIWWRIELKDGRVTPTMDTIRWLLRDLENAAGATP